MEFNICSHYFSLSKVISSLYFLSHQPKSCLNPASVGIWGQSEEEKDSFCNLHFYFLRYDGNPVQNTLTHRPPQCQESPTAPTSSKVKEQSSWQNYCSFSVTTDVFLHPYFQFPRPFRDAKSTQFQDESGFLLIRHFACSCCFWRLLQDHILPNIKDDEPSSHKDPIQHGKFSLSGVPEVYCSGQQWLGTSPWWSVKKHT